MKSHDWSPFILNRRLVLKGAGLMLGLPLLEGPDPRDETVVAASAGATDRGCGVAPATDAAGGAVRAGGVRDLI